MRILNLSQLPKESSFTLRIKWNISDDSCELLSHEEYALIKMEAPSNENCDMYPKKRCYWYTLSIDPVKWRQEDRIPSEIVLYLCVCVWTIHFSVEYVWKLEVNTYTIGLQCIHKMGNYHQGNSRGRQHKTDEFWDMHLKE